MDVGRKAPEAILVQTLPVKFIVAVRFMLHWFKAAQDRPVKDRLALRGLAGIIEKKPASRVGRRMCLNGLNILMAKRCVNAKCLNNSGEHGAMVGNVYRHGKKKKV